MVDITYTGFDGFTLKHTKTAPFLDFQYLFFTRPTHSGYTVFDSDHLDRYNTTLK